MDDLDLSASMQTAEWRRNNERLLGAQDLRLKVKSAYGLSADFIRFVQPVKCAVRHLAKQ